MKKFEGEGEKWINHFLCFKSRVVNGFNSFCIKSVATEEGEGVSIGPGEDECVRTVNRDVTEDIGRECELIVKSKSS